LKSTKIAGGPTCKRIPALCRRGSTLRELP
jgi:hypothetical protein